MTGSAGSPVSVEGHFAECERARGNIAEKLVAKRKEYSEKLRPNIEIHPWDKQVLDTFGQRIRGADPGKAVPEHRTYNPTPGQLQGGLFYPSWGGLNMTQSLITDQQYEVVQQLHLDFRKFAEQFLAELSHAAAPLKVTTVQLKDKLEDIIVGQQLASL